MKPEGVGDISIDRNAALMYFITFISLQFYLPNAGFRALSGSLKEREKLLKRTKVNNKKMTISTG
jgi:hypothetical protein